MKGDKRTIVFWLVEINKDKNTQTWPSANVFFTNPYDILSLYYKNEADYIIVLWVDENPSGTFNLKCHTKKISFNANTNPTSFQVADGNTYINSKQIIDTFTTFKHITGYTSTSNPNGFFQVVMENHFYTYHLDFTTGNQNIQIKHLHNDQNVLSYTDMAITRYSNWGQRDYLWLFTILSDQYKVEVSLAFSNPICWGLNRDLENYECYDDCPIYEEYDWTAGTCRDCATYYSGGKNYAYNHQCVSSCAPYGVGSNNLCNVPNNCSIPLYLNPLTNACVTTCPNYTHSNNVNRWCLNCKDTGKYSHNGICITGGCPAGSELVDTNTNGCLLCSSVNKYFYDESNTCVATCPEFLIPNSATWQCDNCKNSNWYSYNGSCSTTSSCPTGTELVDINRNGCHDCKTLGKFYDAEDTNSCVTSCPSFLVPNSSTGNCDNCKTLLLGYSVNSSCQAGNSCPPGTQLMDSNRNGCKTCQELSKYFNSETNTCVDTCPKYLILNKSLFSCDNCKTLVLGYSYQGKCYAGNSCPQWTILEDSNKNGCYDCKSINKFYENSQCVDQCSFGKFPDTNNVCVGCFPTQYIQNGGCVDTCNSGQFYDNNRVCKTCGGGLVIEENECKSECKTHFGVDMHKTCINCKTLDLVSYKKVCIDAIALPSNTTLILSSYNSYIDCKDAVPKKFLDEGKCLDKCPSGKATYENEFDCID